MEKVSGIPYDEYINKNILEPLGLKNTRTELPEALYGNELAIGYSAVKEETENGKKSVSSRQRVLSLLQVSLQMLLILGNSLPGSSGLWILP